MKKKALFIIFGLFVILFSTPLAYITVDLLYYNKNLTNEYVPLLNGFIHSFMLVGTLSFGAGFLGFFRDKKI